MNEYHSNGNKTRLIGGKRKYTDGHPVGNFEAGKTANYSIKKSGNGVYAFILSGAVTINGEALNKRDGLGISEIDTLNITADTNARLLLMEVPMLN